MKHSILLLFSVIIITAAINIQAGDLKMNSNDSCFSKTNFSIVYNYIEEQIRKNGNGFYEYGSYELYIEGGIEISLKKKGYTHSRINSEKGILSLAKMKNDNDRIVKKTGEIFCEILSAASSGEK